MSSNTEQPLNKLVESVDERTDPWGQQSAVYPSVVPSTALSTGTPVATTELQNPSVEELDEEPSTLWMIFRELTETIVLALVIFLLMRQVIQNYRIESHSMEPTFTEGQFILVNKLAYVLGEPARGDVVVFHNPRNTDQDYIKRIIALPGDTLEIVDQQVLINGLPLDNSFLGFPNRVGERYGPEVIEPGHLFVMGDNRPNSSDSRVFGQLSQDLLVGQAWLRVWPADKWGLIRHYELEPGVPLAVP